MKTLEAKRLRQRFAYYGAIIFEIFEMFMAFFIARRMPTLIGTIAVIITVLISIELNTGNTGNPFIEKHQKVFSLLFFISAIVCGCSLIFILIENGPHMMIRSTPITKG